MSTHHVACTLLSACLAASVAYGAEPARGPIVGDVYTNCEYRVAADFPAEPMVRDFTYQTGAHIAPAREFYVDTENGKLSVTVVHFPGGPDEDRSLLDEAAVELRQRGEVRFESEVAYDDPLVPGRQFNIVLADGRILRAHTYVARQRLYLTEAISTPNDSSAFRFEQSVSFIDENGTDLDSTPVVPGTIIGTSAGLPSRQYDCARLQAH